MLPIFPPTRNHIETLINEVQHSRNIGRIVLSVAIQWDDHVALSEIEARHHRGGFTGVSLEVNDANLPIRIGELVQNCGLVFNATGVDEDDVPRMDQPGDLLSIYLPE